MNADSPADTATDPLARLAALPGVAAAVDAAREAVDRAYAHRIMRRRAPELAAEAALRGARASAALAGADWALEEVRRRSDFGGDEEARTVGAALRLTAEAGPALPVWRTSPARVLARFHLLAAGPGEPDGDVGRPRLAGEPVTDAEAARLAAGLPLPDAGEVAARLDALGRLVVAGTSAPALVGAAVVHGELLALRPFVTRNGPVARAAQRVVLVGGGLDPKSVVPAEVGLAELEDAEPGAYARALAGYAGGTAGGMAAWIAYCGRAVELGARETVAVCEALQRGA
jgi:hypothetical protein